MSLGTTVCYTLAIIVILKGAYPDAYVNLHLIYYCLHIPLNMHLFVVFPLLVLE